MKRFLVPVVVAIVAIAGAVPAIAQVTEDEEAPKLSYHFDDETGELTFAYGVGVDCSEGPEVEPESPEFGDELTPGVADVAEADGQPAIDECTTIDATGPNGQINHGSAVSAAVHALKAYDLDVPRGHIVREFAKSDIGKKDKFKAKDDDHASDESDDLGTDETTDEKAKANGKSNGKKKAKGKNK